MHKRSKHEVIRMMIMTVIIIVFMIDGAIAFLSSHYSHSAASMTIAIFQLLLLQEKSNA